MSNKHTIALSDESYNRLRNCGQFGETYDDIVNRLIQQNEKVKPLKLKGRLMFSVSLTKNRQPSISLQTTENYWTT